ncbi:MAG: short-chain dehydrogenase [Pseudomonadales bacterium]|jgi:NAD(P)-dependent dehydrogenase (short-subunit alcohol dehydrogenase family)|uniref:SDR family NAD(P)-dependent oxidoreductase n=1 Tax=unclassified Ketobacter TaxID=2639109 RepID=UPI000C8CB171|nr:MULTISPECIES: SDR family NAD(P)-dependent oxidoreductase [unclassified Ketobacter]MAQ23055.1 short-chain dehydrogenase [Pseudomonadales bacterium]MEC8813027.1 SDR family NAD(P)-dependent oxidoreductase [Pseudomonadota bacterium]TNC85509.1 MAG: short-chain dehydrogenase [Alcanivorax sp.]HAG93107.1 short-chain dehydrogenase [Gammaproteobacteria bacterium]MAQ26441.1 short-chain dehydrogenase [Pseudomonadales bacterium]|tara:strand:+ start:21802 stop:22572 length:771 start_codon:yes stop_codon:yes gene_type:complete
MNRLLENKVIWITGASSGIGKALAIRLAKTNTVIATSRSQEKLEQLKREYPAIVIKQADVTKPAELASVCGFIEQIFGKLDVLLANAGHCEYLDVRHFDSSIALRMIETNYMGFVYAIESCLHLLRRSETPHIVAVSSSSVYLGLPRAEAYSASKAAVTQFMESLAADLTPEGFSLSVIHPGFVDTELTRQNDFPMPFLMQPDAAAQRIIQGLNRGQYNIDFPKGLTWILRCLRQTPHLIRHRITSSLSRNMQHEL